MQGAKKADAFFNDHAQQPLDVVTSGTEDSVDGIPLGALQMATIHPVVLFEVTDDRFKGLATSELPVLFSRDPLLLAPVDDSDP